MSIIRNHSTTLANHGISKIEWAYDHMSVLKQIKKRHHNRPLLNYKIGMSIHMEAKTACLALLLKDLGADVYATGCNPLSTQDDIATGLVKKGVNVYAIHNASPEEYKEHLLCVLNEHPDLIIDDGGDLFEAYCLVPNKLMENTTP